MGSTSGIFTGNSQFATSFQQEISRATSFASLPMQQMQSEVTTLTAQSGELGKLNNDFFSLQGAISNLDSALGTGSYSGSTGDSKVATASVGQDPAVGTYTVSVGSIGTYASAMSYDDGLNKVSDPAQSGLSDATSYTLSVTNNTTSDVQTFDIETSDTTLTGLARAINDSGSGVQATVVNVGGDGPADYRLSIQDGKMEDSAIQLAPADSPDQTMLGSLTTGAATAYQINGKDLTTGSSAITLASGVSVKLVGTGTTTVTVAQNTNAVSSALANLATAYNAAQTEINSNRGSGAGALNGQSVLSSLSDVLHQISGYATGTDGISSMTALGLSFDKTTFALTFDASVFDDATQGQMAQLTSFLGSTSTGGFVKMANDALNGLTDSLSGLFATDTANLNNSITRDNQTIADDQDRIKTMTTALNAQMAAADTAVAALEQQYSYLNQMFTQMQVNSKSGG